MKEIRAIVEPGLVQGILEALREIPDLPDVVLSDVRECSTSAAGEICANDVKIEVVVPARIASEVVDAITRAAEAGGTSGGRILVSNLEGAADIRDISAQAERRE